MIKYKQIYLQHFGLTTADWIGCVNCSKTSIDIHHLTFKSQGGKDIIENLAAVCRTCHTIAHANKEFNESIRTKHLQNL